MFRKLVINIDNFLNFFGNTRRKHCKTSMLERKITFQNSPIKFSYVLQERDYFNNSFSSLDMISDSHERGVILKLFVKREIKLTRKFRGLSFNKYNF